MTSISLDARVIMLEAAHARLSADKRACRDEVRERLDRICSSIGNLGQNMADEFKALRSELAAVKKELAKSRKGRK